MFFFLARAGAYSSNKRSSWRLEDAVSVGLWLCTRLTWRRGMEHKTWYLRGGVLLRGVIKGSLEMDAERHCDVK
jgi:hypothetical protein